LIYFPRVLRCFTSPAFSPGLCVSAGRRTRILRAQVPHSEIHGQAYSSASPWLIAAFTSLHRTLGAKAFHHVPLLSCGDRTLKAFAWWFGDTRRRLAFVTTTMWLLCKFSRAAGSSPRGFAGRSLQNSTAMHRAKDTRYARSRARFGRHYWRTVRGPTLELIASSSRMTSEANAGDGPCRTGPCMGAP